MRAVFCEGRGDKMVGVLIRNNSDIKFINSGTRSDLIHRHTGQVWLDLYVCGGPGVS